MEGLHHSSILIMWTGLVVDAYLLLRPPKANQWIYIILVIAISLALIITIECHPSYQITITGPD